jgi:hypothetical protein
VHGELLAWRAQALPAGVKALYEDPASSYSFGWSHGQEAMEGGAADVLKGSYYGNPLQDSGQLGAALAAQFPSYCRSASCHCMPPTAPAWVP